MIRALPLLALALAAPAACENAPTAGRALSTLGKVTVKARSGARIPLGARIAPGKPTLIAIWASWCPPCIVEAPYLAKMRKDLGGGYNFIYVNRSDGDPDPLQPPDAIAHFLARGGLADVDYVVADLGAYRRIIGKDVQDIPEGKVGIPRVYLFDANGRQIYTAYGFGGDGDDLERRVEQAMVAK